MFSSSSSSLLASWVLNINICTAAASPRLASPWWWFGRRAAAEFDRGFTSDTGRERLDEIKARARADELSPAPGSYTGVQEIVGPRRDETTHVSLIAVRDVDDDVDDDEQFPT